jgi:hypothetical protein
MITKPCIAYEIGPFDNLNHAAKLSAEFLNSPSSVRSRPPSVGVNFQLSNDICNHVAVENAIVRNADTTIAKIEYLAASLCIR